MKRIKTKDVVIKSYQINIEIWIHDKLYNEVFDGQYYSLNTWKQGFEEKYYDKLNKKQLKKLIKHLIFILNCSGHVITQEEEDICFNEFGISPMGVSSVIQDFIKENKKGELL